MPGQFRLGLAQCTHPVDGDVLALVERCACEAASKHVDLLVFPECLMTPFEKTREDYLASAQPLDGPFAQGMASIAARHELWVVFTMNELGKGTLPFNTAVVLDDAGTRRGVYRKTHLYDALSVRESDRMARGGVLFEPIDTPFCKLGLGICYDLRFPEVARAAALAGCELFVLPAAWVAGPHKAAQWKTLLAARAIENEMFVAGLSRADEKYIGSSCIVDPRGVVLAEAPGRQSTLLTTDVDLDVLRAARAGMPLFAHRRPELYQSLARQATAQPLEKATIS